MSRRKSKGSAEPDPVEKEKWLSLRKMNLPGLPADASYGEFLRWQVSYPEILKQTIEFIETLIEVLSRAAELEKDAETRNGYLAKRDKAIADIEYLQKGFDLWLLSGYAKQAKKKLQDLT